MSTKKELEIRPGEGDGVEVNEVGAGGIVMDKRGRKWAIPSGELEDLDDLHGGLTVPEPEPNFAYQYVNEGHVREALLKGWVTVDRDEVGIPALEEDQEGHALTTYHQVGDSVLMKMPKVLQRRLVKAKERRVREELDEISAASEVDKKVEESGFVSSTKVERHSDPAPS